MVIIENRYQKITCILHETRGIGDHFWRETQFKDLLRDKKWTDIKKIIVTFIPDCVEEPSLRRWAVGGHGIQGITMAQTPAEILGSKHPFSKKWEKSKKKHEHKVA